MSSDDIDILLRIKRAREQQAGIASHRARAACARAMKACGRAEMAVAGFAAARPAEEATIYRHLTAGPVPVHRLRHAAAQLSEIAAQAEALQQRLAQARQHAEACDVTREAARGRHAAAQRDVIGASAARAQLDMAAYEAGERRQDAELEELAGQCRRDMPA